MMKTHTQLSLLLTLLVMLYSPFALCQEEASAAEADTDSENSASQETATSPDQEVEVNEDNYRQFMELKDTRQQRVVFPETAYKPQTGNQKLSKLPEESQKHLRNELREIIVQGDKWKPGDEEGEYPYAPSAAAGNNPTLQKQEAEAWGELVEGYHDREAEIYANSARSQSAAAAAEQGQGSNAGQGSSGNEASQGAAGEQASQESQNRQKSRADSYSANAANDSDVKNTEGVSQNAMEFLQRNGNANQPSQNQPSQNQVSSNNSSGL